MAIHRTSQASLFYGDYNDPRWDLFIVQNALWLNTLRAIGGLCVLPVTYNTTTLLPTGLNVQQAAGVFVKSDNTRVTVAAVASFAVAPSATNYLWLTAAGVLTANTTGFPTGTNIFPLATVTANATDITGFTDERYAFRVSGGGFGSATTDLIGFYGATRVTQPASASQSVLTDSTTGTAGTTISNVGASFSQTTLNNNFASVVRLVNQLRSDLVQLGLLKGSA